MIGKQRPGGLDPAHFMQEYWQRKPLLIRHAFDMPEPPLRKEELAGLACEDEVASRVIQERHPDGPWKLDHGPFDADFFASLPEDHWTLLVSDCEKHLPALHALIEPFRFIPDWRIDDLMISYAADSGSVGPHTDDYDVFLIQLEGVREWQISRHVEHEDIIEGIDLRILRRFEPEQSWQLNPGDMLYLPPRVAHHGIARGECMTASVGFRAPSWREILQGYLEEIIMRIPADRRYGDAAMAPQAHPGEIRADAIAHFHQIIEQSLRLDDDAFHRWVGELVTEPKTGLPPDEAPPALTDEAFVAALLAGERIMRNPHARFAWSRHDDDLILFCDGQSWTLPVQCIGDVQRLTEASELSGDSVTADMYTVLYELYLAEAILFDEEE